MSTQRILLVDDDTAMLDDLSALIRKEGFDVETATSGEEGLTRARETRPDLVVLDIAFTTAGPAGLDGIEVLRRLRAESDACVLMLTQTSIGYVKVSTLEIGADDYVTKPFNPDELVARIRAILRRANQGEERPRVLDFGTLRIDPGARRVFAFGKEVGLTPIEFDILLSLARRPGQVMGRRDLITHAWEREFDSDERLVDVHVGRIRKKIEETPAKPKRIITVWGKGYRFEADVPE